MSTLEYLDSNGSVKNFSLVPWTILHDWLSTSNGNKNISSHVPKGVNRGKILEELEARRKGEESTLMKGTFRLFNMDRGYGKDWREYENNDGYTHLEELLMFQPYEWRKQAREYFFRFQCNITRESTNEDKRTIFIDVPNNNNDTLHRRNQISLFMKTPILMILFHKELKRSDRYEPLNFLLAYGVRDPLSAIFKNISETDQCAIREDLSPLDYFLEFQNYVSSYRLDKLRTIGKKAAVPRLCLIKELDFCDLIGQRLAKQMVRHAVVSYIWNRSDEKKGICANLKHPLSMIFAGPSGNGKTELAHWLAKLMNKPQDDFFIKVDCGKLSDASEMFGKSGAYQGAEQGSALNNFVLRMSFEKEEAIGIVLLDEIEKADQGVIHALYQVIDKGEWTNKRLTKHGSQTDIISCHNIIFIMTTNACDYEILNFTKQHNHIYHAVGDDMDTRGSELATRIRGSLQFTYPFTEAFLGRIGHIIPFLPMADSDPDINGVIHGERMTVAKLLIERQQDKFSDNNIAEVEQAISSKTKHNMAKIVLREAIEEAGVRSIQSAVERRMSDRIMNSLLLEQGGIEEGSYVRYFSSQEDQVIDYRVEDFDDTKAVDEEFVELTNVKDDQDLYE